MTVSSRWRYLAWRASGSSRPVQVVLKSGEQLILRPEPATDLAVAHEVFVRNVYQVDDIYSNREVRRIVDLGANVGFTCLYWARSHPKARIHAFEPHPRFAAMARRHLALNQVGSVDIVEAAVSDRDGHGDLTDDENRSKLTTNANGKIPVSVVDFFSAVGSKPIDVLKVDIEGSEYALLNDVRFERLRVRCIVLEWHMTPEYPRGADWCIRRFESLNYKVEVVEADPPRSGVIRAYQSGSIE